MKACFLKMLVPVLAAPLILVQADAPVSKGARQQDRFAAPPRSARPSDEAIKAAVRATLDEMPDSDMPATGTVLSGDPYREFARKFSEAEKPHCMGPNALKHQPAGFSTRNWNFGAGGLFALPFWGAAILRGKCSWGR